MKITSTLIVAILAATFSLNSYAQEVTFQGGKGAGDLGAIPDDGGAVGATFTCTVEGVGVLEKFNFINMYMDITHGWVEDLEITLTSPAGTTITLANALGGDGDNYSQTMFTQTASKNIQDGQPPFTGEWLPQETPKGLAAFDGEDADGDWTLTCKDHGALIEGTLNEWSLTFNPTKHLDPPSADFTFFTMELTALFTNKTTNTVDSYAWDFGDGNTSVERSPQHEYSTSGAYDVMLIATNANGSDTVVKEVVVEGTGTETAVFNTSATQIKAYPNPFNNVINLDINPNDFTSIQLLDASGRLIKSFVPQEQIQVNQSLEKGIYMLRLIGENKTAVSRLFKN